MTTVLQVSDVSKSYVLSHKNLSKYKSLREDISDFTKNVFSKTGGGKKSKELFWALQDINFEISQGDRVAIIGKNGAGKSTLLKLLSRVTKPTSGQIKIKGRLSSLLEVGTGFHPELTGRENIFLNGSLLGMSRQEVREKFDEIVEFAEVERFLDTPVKRYSSGMYVRLAFSVAAHLEPDILLVDEVLAVGDIQFQKKCLGKIREVSHRGRTILLVSHNLAVVQSICNSGLLLNAGKSDGVVPIGLALEKYKNMLVDASDSATQWVNSDPEKAFVHEIITPLEFSFSDEENNYVAASLNYLDTIHLNVVVEVHQPSEELTIGYALYDSNDNLLYWSFNVDVDYDINSKLRIGINSLNSILPLDVLNEGQYKIKLLLGLYNRQWIIGPDDDGPTLSFSVEGALSVSPYWIMKRPGFIAPRINWRLAND